MHRKIGPKPNPTDEHTEQVTVLRRMLVIDADTDTRTLYRTAFPDGCEIIEAADGRDALAKALVDPPSLIVTGWHLPLIDGAALCESASKPHHVRCAHSHHNERRPPNRVAADTVCRCRCVLIKPTTPERVAHTPKVPRCPTCNSTNTLPVSEHFGEQTLFCGACGASWSMQRPTTRERNK